MAFVGSIEAVGQRIWTAIGTTVNMAARLESLTRNLDAEIVIDQTTWEALNYQRADFDKHEGVAIRGRSDSQCVYLRPLTH